MWLPLHEGLQGLERAPGPAPVFWNPSEDAVFSHHHFWNTWISYQHLIILRFRVNAGISGPLFGKSEGRQQLGAFLLRAGWGTAFQQMRPQVPRVSTTHFTQFCFPPVPWRHLSLDPSFEVNNRVGTLYRQLKRILNVTVTSLLWHRWNPHCSFLHSWCPCQLCEEPWTLWRSVPR